MIWCAPFMSAVFFIAMIDALKTHCRGVDHFNARRLTLGDNRITFSIRL